MGSGGRIRGGSGASGGRSCALCFSFCCGEGTPQLTFLAS